MKHYFKNYSSWLSYFKSKFDREFILVSSSKDLDDCFTFKHRLCGTKITTYPQYIKYLHCPNSSCCPPGRQITDEQFKERAYSVWGDLYTVLGTYLRWNVPVKVRCNRCSSCFPTIPNNFLRGAGCPNCKRHLLSRLHTTPYQEAEHTIEKLTDSELIILQDTYIGTNTKATFYHKICKSKFETKPNNVICNGSRCPYCYLKNKQSRGEHYIQKCLDTWGISYEYPKKFSGLKNKYPLRYDFYIEDYNLLIEYQGKQHYYPVSIFGGESHFKIQQKNDIKKLLYAKNNGINILYIPYMVDTLDKVKNFLLSYLHATYSLIY